MSYWLVKSEPEAYAWAQLVKDGVTAWTGVRNFAARNHLRAMRTGDLVFFYHSGEETVPGLASRKAPQGLRHQAAQAFAGLQARTAPFCPLPTRRLESIPAGSGVVCNQAGIIIVEQAHHQLIEDDRDYFRTRKGGTQGRRDIRQGA